MKDAIETLRFALASIWTELENDNPNVENCQQIADEALSMTSSYASPGKKLSLEVGLEAWKEHKQK